MELDKTTQHSGIYIADVYESNLAVTGGKQGHHGAAEGVPENDKLFGGQGFRVFYGNQSTVAAEE